jgi:hypothetical protein
VIDRRAMTGVAAGVLGLALGAASAVWEVVQLAVIAGALALVAGVSALRLFQLLRSADDEITALSSKVDELSDVAERESKARLEAEADRDAQFADRTNRTAVREDGGAP